MSSSECLRSQLIAAGFQPQRFGFLVKLVRRLIWPFIRPFHFFQLEKLNDLTQLIDSLPHRDDTDLLLLRTELSALKHKVIDSLSSPPCSPNLLITATKYGLFIAKPAEIISDAILQQGVWDEHIIQFAQQVASTRRGVAIDVGTHFGSTTLGLATIFDHVYSFEPNDFNFRIFRANVALNNLQNVSLYNNALYSHATQLSLGIGEKQEVAIAMKSDHFDGLASSNLGAYLFTENGSGIFNHPARTLDSYEFNQVAFIKIDVQGADGEVLMGALQTIQRCQPIIVFEWEEKLAENFSVSFHTIKNELSRLGYEISILKKHNEKQIDYIAQPISARNENTTY